MGIETERHLELHCSLGPDALFVRHFAGTEYLGRGFEYTLMLYSQNHDIEMEALLGTHASVRVRLGTIERFFDGIVFEFTHMGTTGRHALYRMLLRPWLWVLGQNRDCRVFQNQTTPDIVKEIIKEEGLGPVEESLMGVYKPRGYCVQYRESQLTFIQRLLDDEGIYYFFRHENGKHMLVLADSGTAHKPAPSFETLSYGRLEHDKHPAGQFFEWRATKRVESGQVTLLDYDFEKPSADMRATGVDRRQYEHADGEWFDYPGHYKVVKSGDEIARVRIEELMATHAMADGETDAIGLYAGCLVTLADHPRKDQNKEHLLIGVSYEIDSGSFETGDGGGRALYQARTRAIDSKVQFRPQRTTRSPTITGVQTATVVGPKNQEIWTDSYGRVKVQFHWDRRGKRDENSSCFVRVAQAAAGAKWGSIFIPRIGQEVVVEFVDGHPDHPLITGCVFNKSNGVPYELPSKRTQSGIKTHSTKDASPEQYNEFRFEDAKGSEQVYLQAQRDFVTEVKNDSTHHIKNKLSVTVDEAEYTILVKGGAMTTTVPQDTYEVDAKKIHLHVGPNEIVIDEAMITITCGASKITLTPVLQINGTAVKLN